MESTLIAVLRLLFAERLCIGSLDRFGLGHEGSPGLALG